MPSRPTAQASSRRVAALAAIVFVTIVLRHAWMMDDTYITLRVVANLFDGHGLTWNPGHRVWVYTHPLWMLVCCVVYAITSEFYYSLLLLGTALSAAALLVVAVRLAREQFVGVLVILAATLSHAFVDYSTSGLENPLTNLLIALFAWVYFGRLPSARQFRSLCLIGGLALLNRPDNALLLGPAVIAAGIQAHKRGAGVRELVRAALVGGIPLWLWELFALVYYGVLVPNTALAKLNTGIESSELFEQGLFYALATLDADPLTLVVILAGLAAPALAWRRRTLPFAIGLGLGVFYVIDVGGDFMLGRQWVAPMFVGLICLSQIRRVSPAQRLAGAGVIVLLGFATEPNTIEINRQNSADEKTARTDWHITDERALLYAGTGLVNASRTVDMPSHEWVEHGLRGTKMRNRTSIVRAVGFRAFYADSDIHWIDDPALTDPLLARMPALYDPEWMHGHFIRHVPDGYRNSLADGDNQLENDNLAQVYDRIRIVTEGDLFSRERFAAIGWLNTGKPAKLIRTESWRFVEAVELKPDAIGERVPDGTPLDAPELVAFENVGVYIHFDGRVHHRELELSVNDADRFEVRFYDGSEEVARVPIGLELAWEVTGVSARRVSLPAVLAERGFTRLRILPRTRARTREPYFAFGHLLFDEAIDATEAPAPIERAKNRGNERARPGRASEPIDDIDDNADNAEP